RAAPRTGCPAASLQPRLVLRERRRSVYQRGSAGLLYSAHTLQPRPLGRRESRERHALKARLDVRAVGADFARKRYFGARRRWPEIDERVGLLVAAHRRPPLARDRDESPLDDRDTLAALRRVGAH